MTRPIEISLTELEAEGLWFAAQPGGIPSEWTMHDLKRAATRAIKKLGFQICQRQALTTAQKAIRAAILNGGRKR